MVKFRLYIRYFERCYQKLYMENFVIHVYKILVKYFSLSNRNENNVIAAISQLRKLTHFHCENLTMYQTMKIT